MDNKDFIAALASGSPTPGGGGASALVGAIGAALCSMVANLTAGKQKYAQYQSDIERILNDAGGSAERLTALIDRDAEVFAPLAAAYGIPKDDPNRASILEHALSDACSVPLDILRELKIVCTLITELEEKGSRLAVSDVGVAAATVEGAARGAAMNVYINTKLMTNRVKAAELNTTADTLLSDITVLCGGVYGRIRNKLEGTV